MNLSNFRAPYFTKSQSHQAADNFRSKYWVQESLPVDIHQIIEFDLKMEIRTISNLRQDVDVDALLLGDLNTIVVDREMFMDDRMLSRMRYSLAHEIGHKFLHPNLYSEMNPTSVEEWISSFRSIPEDQYKWIELHAYEFAGRLLVPPNILQMEFNKQITLGKEKGFQEWDNSGEDALEYLAHAISMASSFGVSEQVITKRLKIEGLWPVR
jgi:hypothetical protein